MLILTACEQCGKPLGEPTQPSRQPPRRFCSARCRGRHWREERQREVREALGAAERAMELTRVALAPRERKGRHGS